jgi:hypothetical protein
MRAFAMLVGMAVVVLSAQTYENAPAFVQTGTVLEVLPGEWLRFRSEATDPGGIRLVLSATAVYRGGAAALTPGTCVRVRYRLAAGSRPTIEEVEALPAATGGPPGAPGAASARHRSGCPS